MSFLVVDTKSGSFWLVPYNLIANRNDFDQSHADRVVLMESIISFRRARIGEDAPTPLLASKSGKFQVLEGKALLFSKSRKCGAGAFRLALNYIEAATSCPLGQWVSRMHGAQLSMVQIFRVKAILRVLRQPKYATMTQSCKCSTCKNEVEEFIKNTFLR